MSDHIDLNNDSKNNDMLTLSKIVIPQEYIQEENDELKNIIGNKPVDIRRSQKFSLLRSQANRPENNEGSNSSKRVINNSNNLLKFFALQIIVELFVRTYFV